MARTQAGLRPVALGLLLLAGHAAAQTPLLSRVGDALLTLTNAIDTVRDLQNTTRGIVRAARAGRSQAQPITRDPFSVRVLKVDTSGGPLYEWRAKTQASPANVTVAVNETAAVKFTTRYTRVLNGFNTYTVTGAVELRNLQSDPVVLEGPVKVLVSIKRPAGVTTGPEVVTTTQYASCGKASPIHVPARRGGRAGVVKCSFEAVLPQAAALMEAAEAAVKASAANGSVSAASLKAARAPESPLTPDVTLAVEAKPAPTEWTPAGAQYTLPEARSQPYKALFDIPERACLDIADTLTGPIAKYVLGGPAAGAAGAAARTICGSATLTQETKLGGFDASACGSHTLATGGSKAEGGKAAVTVSVSGCNRTVVGHPDVAITKLSAVRLLNHTWSVATSVAPLSAESRASGAADTRTLQLPIRGVGAANFTLRVTKNEPIDLGSFLQGEITVSSGSLVPDVIKAVRLAVTAGNATTYHDAKCPGTVVLPLRAGIGGLKCTFNVPMPKGNTGTVQAQVKSITSQTFDVHSGTPKPFDLTSASDVNLGQCATLDRAYVGSTSLDVRQRPIVSLVNGVDALLGAVRVNLTRAGLPKPSIAELLGLDSEEQQFSGLSLPAGPAAAAPLPSPASTFSKPLTSGTVTIASLPAAVGAVSSAAAAASAAKAAAKPAAAAEAAPAKPATDLKGADTKGADTKGADTKGSDVKGADAKAAAPAAVPPAEAKPAVVSKPAAEAKPAADAKVAPVAEAKPAPAAEAKAATEAKPAAQAKAAPATSDAKPAAEAKPTTEAKPAPAAEAKPTTEAKPVPAAEVKHTPEAKPAAEAKPTQTGTFAPRPAPAKPAPAGGARRLAAAPAQGAARAAGLDPGFTLSLMGQQLLHPLKVSAGAAPPAPGAAKPLTLCGSETFSWTEAFGGAPPEACGTLFSALSTVTLSPNGTALGAQPAIARNVTLPVLVGGCEVRPTVKLLALRPVVTRGYSWTVSAKAADRIVALPQAGKPTPARFTVTYNRTTAVGNYSVDPAVLLSNPFSAPMAVEGVYASLQLPGKPELTVRMRCKGASASGVGALLLPGVPAPGAEPVPVGCIGSLPLAGPVAGNVTITTVTQDAKIVTGPVEFDARQSPEVTLSDKLRCVTLEGGFAPAIPGAKALQPGRISPGAPVPGSLLCEPRRFTFDGYFGPFGAKDDVCGSYTTRYVASIRGATRAAAASTPIAVHTCAKKA